jgi:hypothetical protein
MGAENSKAATPYVDASAMVGEVWNLFGESSHGESPSSPSSVSIPRSCSSSTLTLEDGTVCETVIVFDWDDTLLCSTAINSQQWSQEQLVLLEQAVQCILATAMSLGETLIVTNGISSWVQDSARRFLPSLVPIIERLQVHSARAKYELSYPGDPMEWKNQAFKDIFVSRRRQIERFNSTENWQPWADERPSERPSSPGSSISEGPCVVNMVVLGDSPAEIEAARAAGRILGKPSLVKTVKFKEGPSVNELVGQLRRVAQELGQVVNQEESMHRSLIQRPLPANLDYLASWAYGWKFCEEKPAQITPIFSR